MKKGLIGILLLLNVLLAAQNVINLDVPSTHPEGLKYLEKSKQYIETKPDSSIYFLELAIPFFEKQKDWERLVLSYVGLSKSYYEKRQFEGFDESSNKAYELAQKHLADNNLAFLESMIEIGNKKAILGDNEEAIKIYNHLLEEYTKLGIENERANMLDHIATCYINQEHFQRALEYSQQSTKVARLSLSKNSLELVPKIYNVAQSFFYLRNIEKALENLEQLKEILIYNDRWDTNDNWTLFCNELMAKIYVILNRYEEAEFYLHKIFTLSTDSLQLVTYYDIQGRIGMIEKNCGKALENYKIFNELMFKMYGHFNKHVQKNYSLMRLSSAFQKCGYFSKALAYNQKALIQSSPSFYDTSYLKNPNVNDIPLRNVGKILIPNKANILYEMYKKNNDVIFLEAALETYQLFIPLINRLRQDYWAIGSRAILSEEILPHYEKAILIALELFNQSNNLKYQEIAFSFAEGNKSILLLESLRENVAKGFGGIPDSLIAVDKKITLNINYYEKQIAEEKNKKNQDEEIINRYKDELFALENEYEVLMKYIEENFPKYYQLKYDFSTPSLRKIQKELNEQEQIIEYFIGKENLVIFSITKEKVATQKYPLNEGLKKSINILLELVKKEPDSHEQQVDFSSFVSSAQQLYQQLIAPVLDVTTKKLIIIPDDQLNYLPFEVLLTSTQTNSEVLYATLAYLFREIDINYHYSANLYNRTKAFKNTQSTQTFVGFAPSFGESMVAQTRNCTNDELYSLSCSQRELENIAALFNKSQPIMGRKATKDNFDKQAVNGQILHLATHACVNEQDPMLSKIYFSDDYLTYYDLNNLTLNADLAVLSACNTGSGKLAKGEGVMSLAKGFIQAGVPSVVTSLWSVDDCATSDIMIQFYKYLREGQTKSEALRNAKLLYLQTKDKIHAHPFYWGAFVQYGNTNSLEYMSEEKYWALILFVGFIAMIFIVFCVQYKYRVTSKE